MHALYMSCYYEIFLDVIRKIKPFACADIEILARGISLQVAEARGVWDSCCVNLLSLNFPGGAVWVDTTLPPSTYHLLCKILSLK